MEFKNNKLFLIGLAVCLTIGFVIFNNNSNSEEKGSHGGEDTVYSGHVNSIDSLPSVAARINDVEIKQVRVKMAVKAIIERLRITGQELEHNRMQELIKEAVDGLVGEELLYQEGKHFNISVTDEEVGKEIKMLKSRFSSEAMFEKMLKEQDVDLETIRKEIKKNMTIMKVIKTQIDDKVSIINKEVKDYYEANRDKLKDPPSVKASHILIRVSDRTDEKEKGRAMEKIKDLLGRAKSGEDFGKLAKEFSEGPSAPKGGDLGYFSKGMMVIPFEKAAFSLKAGEISDIVETQFGYHIIKLFDIRKGKLQSFEEAKEKITAFLKIKKRQEKLFKWIEELKKKAKIEILM